MSHAWIERFGCDRCGLCIDIEKLDSDESWPHGWKEVTFTGDKPRLLCPVCAKTLRAALAQAKSDPSPPTRPNPSKSEEKGGIPF